MVRHDWHELPGKGRVDTAADLALFGVLFCMLPHSRQGLSRLSLLLNDRHSGPTVRSLFVAGY